MAQPRSPCLSDQHEEVMENARGTGCLWRPKRAVTVEALLKRLSWWRSQHEDIEERCSRRDPESREG